jgi:hypothetical protein
MPVLHQDRTNGVKDNNCVIADRADIPNDLVSTLPKRQVVPVTPVTIDSHEALTGVCVAKNDASGFWQ